MSNDDESMYIQLIRNQRVVTYNNLRGMNPMSLSAPWDDYKNKQFNTNIKIITNNLMMQHQENSRD